MKAIPRISLNYEVHLVLSETEARALDAIVGYGFDDFMKVFKEHMGKHYISGHERGAETLFSSVRDAVGPQLSHITASRNLLREKGMIQ